MNQYWVLTFGVLSWLLSGCQSSPTTPIPLTEADKANIMAFKDIHVKAMLSGDPAVALPTYSEDVILLPPDGKILRGAAEAEKFLQASMQQKMEDLTLTPIEIHGYDDMAYVVGTAVIKMAPGPAASEGDAFPALAKFTWIVRRQADDSWKIAVDIWNGTPPNPAQTE